MKNPPSLIRNAALLTSVLKKLGVEVNPRTIRSSFEERLYIQKLVYMLNLNPEFRRYLGFVKYSMYLYGPYSPELADVYYNMPETLPRYEITISDEALEYGREIAKMSPEDLEIAATIIEILKTNPGITEDIAIRRVHELKFYLGRSKAHIREIFEHIKKLARKYKLEVTRSF